MSPSLNDILWVLVSACLVFVMQAGFLCLETGLTRSKNNINVALKNLTDFGVAVLLFWALGFGIMFGPSWQGWIGTSDFAINLSQDALWPAVFFFFQVMFCGTAVTILAGAVAERMRFAAYLITAALVSGIIYPVFGHWAWNGLQTGESIGWLAAWGFVDFAGSTVVHSVGGWVSLAALLVIGARADRFPTDGPPRRISGANLPLATLGVLLLWFGWFGFNAGSTLALDNRVPGIIVNTILAGAAGLVVTLLWAWRTRGLAEVGWTLNGVIAGLVAITANCHLVSSLEAVLIGSIGGIVMLLADGLLERLQIDDAVGAIPAHLAAGIWGTLAVAIFGQADLLPLDRGSQLLVQGGGMLLCGVWSFGFTYVALRLLALVLPLRVSLHDEHIGLNVSEHNATTEILDLFTAMEQQSQTQDLSLRMPVEPFTEVGQIAQRYNRVMDALEQAVTRTDAIVRTAVDAIITFSRPELRIMSTNPAAEAMFGYQAEHIDQQRITLLFAPAPSLMDDANGNSTQTFENLLPQMVATGMPYELQGRHQDGTLFPLEVLVTEAQVGPEQFYTGIFRDIAERKQAQERLHRQNLYLSALHETTLAMINHLDLNELLETIMNRAGYLLGTQHGYLYLIDPDGQTMEVRVATGVFTKYKGYHIKPDEGLAGKTWQTGEAIVIDDYDSWAGRSPAFQADRFGSVMGVPLKSGTAIIGVLGMAYVNTERRFGDNEVEVLSRFAQLVSLAIDNAQLYAAAQQEINERIRVQDELRRQKEYLESLVSNSPVAIVVADISERILSWNPAAETLFGYSQEEVIGQTIYQAIGGTSTAHAEMQYHLGRIKQQERIQCVTQRTRKDDSLVDVEVIAVPVKVAADQMGMIAIYYDITELLRARRLAEAANQAKSEFLATMSHEIRTPMNAIIGMSGLLMDTPLSERQYEFANTIRTSGDALLTIINDILDFSKIEANKLELEHQAFDLHDCVESALDLVSTRAAEKGLDLAYLIDASVPDTIVGDVTRVRQILVNLLSNGVKFTSQGEVVVSVAAQPLPAASPERGAQAGKNNSDPAALPSEQRYEIHFAVRDTGIGIPTERMSRLFKSFSQVDSSTTRQYGGTGLGLVISKHLSELMGGQMWVESSGIPGNGSTFHFTIHAAKAPTDVIRRHRQSQQPELRGKRLLIVDDNATNRLILLLQAQSWGMKTEAAATPAEALTWLERGDRFDIAILDMHMPEMDGVMLANKIRRYYDAARLPLVMLTSLGAHETDAIEQAARFAAFLTKPVKASHLYDTLVEVVAGSRVPGQTMHEPPEQVSPFDADMAQRLPLRILLAEDNTINQRLALLILERLGYRADVAANGLEVLEALERQPYDVVLMDVQMPMMDGLEATRQLQQRVPPDQQPYVIAMTANAMQGDREMCLDAGMNDYLTKPIDISELVVALSGVKPAGLTSQPEPAAPAPPGTTPQPQTDASDPATITGPAPTEPAHEPAILDPAALHRLRKTLGNQADVLLPDLIDDFFKDGAHLQEQAQQALAQNEAETLRRAAHTLKSNSSNFGATTLANLCQQLETHARDQNLADAATILHNIEEEFSRTRAALEAIQKDL